MKSVLDHHEASTRSASICSAKASSARRLMFKSIRSSKDTIELFENEVKKFDECMKEVQKREEDRIDLERRI